MGRHGCHLCLRYIISTNEYSIYMHMHNIILCLLIPHFYGYSSDDHKKQQLELFSSLHEAIISIAKIQKAVSHLYI